MNSLINFQTTNIYIDAIRGDDTRVDILTKIPDELIGGIVSGKLGEINEYNILYSAVTNTYYFIIPNTITKELSGPYVFNIVATKGEIVNTIQHTNIYYIDDVTRQNSRNFVFDQVNSKWFRI